MNIAIIPARGGSKGIPRKNMRLMHGKPLIRYAIENALSCSCIDDIVVTSDSPEILSYASQFDGVSCLDRSSGLAQDAITLDPVIYDAVVRREKTLGQRFDTVITLQPTSPLLAVKTLDAAIMQFENSEYCSMISVVNKPHLSWREDGRGNPIPNYERRLNRQQLPPCYMETGAFFITKRDCVTPSSRLGSSVTVFEVPEAESVDVDTKWDWVECEAMLSRKSIAFRVDGYKELGLGHVFRTLTLAYEFIEHDITFLCDPSHQEGIEQLRTANMPIVEVENEEALFSWLKANHPDIYVHDCLDTSVNFIDSVKSLVPRVVTFEDLGQGSKNADAVVNAIYEKTSPHGNVYTGKRYVCLRDEFLTATPAPFREKVKRALVMFGGTDPLNLSERVYHLARRYNADGIKIVFDFVLGLGCDSSSIVPDNALGIEVSHNVTRVCDHMRRSDIAFSSQGRTTFELACMGVPAIVLAQNEREQLHTFAQMDNGFINLGLGSEVSDEDLASAFEWLVGARSIRREMRRLMLSNDLRSGIKQVKRIILGETI